MNKIKDTLIIICLTTIVVEIINNVCKKTYNLMTSNPKKINNYECKGLFDCEDEGCQGCPVKVKCQIIQLTKQEQNKNTE